MLRSIALPVSDIRRGPRSTRRKREVAPFEIQASIGLRYTMQKTNDALIQMSHSEVAFPFSASLV